MIEKCIARVPRHIWEEGRPQRAPKWDAQFNVAGWVRFTAGGGNVQLVVRYLDNETEASVLVDTAVAQEKGSVLLSGVIGLRLSARIEQVQICLRLSDPSMVYVVEELLMQRRGMAAGVGDKLISNF